MKKILLLISLVGLCSCATISTKSHQNITFKGSPGTRIYDAGNNVKLAEIKEDSVSISLKKGVSDKMFLIKKDDSEPLMVTVQSSFNKKSLWNIIFWPGFFVDWGTGQINQYSNTEINLND